MFFNLSFSTMLVEHRGEYYDFCKRMMPFRLRSQPKADIKIIAKVSKLFTKPRFTIVRSLGILYSAENYKKSAIKINSSKRIFVMLKQTLALSLLSVVLNFVVPVSAQAAVICSYNCSDGSGTPPPESGGEGSSTYPSALFIVDLLLVDGQDFTITANNIYVSNPLMSSATNLHFVGTGPSTAINSTPGLLELEGVSDYALLTNVTGNELELTEGDVWIRVIENASGNGTISLNSLTLNVFDSLYIADTIVANTVPLPAGAWLFGSALIGLAGIKRKK
jgi:hypothetical protein